MPTVERTYIDIFCVSVLLGLMENWFKSELATSSLKSFVCLGEMEQIQKGAYPRGILWR